MDVYAKSASTYVFKSTDPVMVVAFESSSSENGVPVVVEVLKNRSKFIGDNAPGKPYKYFNVFVGTSGFSQKVSKGVIAYRVNNSWLKENNIDPADISLYKWRGTWVKLNTEIAESRSNYTYYASLTGNFSSFAIAATKDKKIDGVGVSDISTLSEGQNTTQAMANLSGDGPKHKIPGLSAVAILVFGIAGVILYLKRNHKKFNRDVRK
jgi:PGF-pre-PGF domain-containing protein